MCPHMEDTKQTNNGKKAIFYLEAKADSLSLVLGDAVNSVASRDFKASSFNLDGIRK